MTEPATARPPQVTFAAAVLMLGSALLVALVFQRFAGLHTRQTHEPVIRTFGMVAAACATVTAILGYQVLQRRRSARVVISVLALPLFVSGLATGGVVSSVVVASAVMLWLQPARAWFDGVAPPERRTPASPPAAAPRPERGELPPNVWPAPRTAGSEDRPSTVLWACVLTWISSGLVIVGLIAGGVTLVVDPDLMLEEAHRQNPDLAAQGVTDGLLVAVTVALLAGLVVWCLLAVATAVLVFRRVGWARIVLIVSASVAGVLCLGGSALGAIVLVAPLLACVVTVALLARPDTGAWFERR